jgi:arsenate reductase (thioredoxin)
MPNHCNVLILCTGNSARSIMAEAILNHRGQPNFTAYSAGSHPSGKVNPYALKQLEYAGLPTTGLHSKSWDEFAKPGALPMNLIIIVCDNTASEVWPGQPLTALWGIPDPATASGSPEQSTHAFRDAFLTLDRRIGLRFSLPLASLDSLAAKEAQDQIARE